MTADLERLLSERTSPPPEDDEPEAVSPGDVPATADEVEDADADP